HLPSISMGRGLPSHSRKDAGTWSSGLTRMFIFFSLLVSRASSAWSIMCHPRGRVGDREGDWPERYRKGWGFATRLTGGISVESGLCAFWLQDLSTKPTVSRDRPRHMKILCGAAACARGHSDLSSREKRHEGPAAGGAAGAGFLRRSRRARRQSGTHHGGRGNLHVGGGVARRQVAGH